jgi:hypothetical protein
LIPNITNYLPVFTTGSDARELSVKPVPYLKKNVKKPIPLE